METKPKAMARGRKPVTGKLSLASLEASITAYYGSLTPTEIEEDAIWGEFAGLNLALEEDEALQV